ncbi:hypothetical protein KDD17_08555 [Sulfitobacter albidus]|uniref:Uncharacterized protein n=1 Tax=Sulfitobacter albidus TaxID=2829501 RepID=A0A975JAY3_9RHOB|nr:hypothetical protein [Sulfitobacter albidus]QUJ75091.1 hypothetical protein KDD17_08555 [Sulfitobacter albidus]
MSLPYSYTATPRSRTAALVVAAIWTVLALAWWVLDASPLIVAVLAAFTLPALYEIVAQPQASFTLDATHIRWHTPHAEAEIALSGVNHIRLDTRLDMSVRVSVVLSNGRKLRVPVPATPPHTEVDTAARAAGLTVKRHHFSLIG